MQIFVSWSGKVSQQMAISLKNWLPLVIQSLDPYVSSADIAAGQRWSNEIAHVLGACKFGVICVTKDNWTKPWLNFEAGALSNSFTGARVTPLLFDIDPANISGPLAQFQAVRLDEVGIQKLLVSLNDNLLDSKLPTERLNLSFGQWWPVLERQIQRLRELPEESVGVVPHRTDRELLEELLQVVRSWNHSAIVPLSQDARDAIEYVRDGTYVLESLLRRDPIPADTAPSVLYEMQRLLFGTGFAGLLSPTGQMYLLGGTSYATNFRELPVEQIIERFMTEASTVYPRPD